jgi:hypothetical protein
MGAKPCQKPSKLIHQMGMEREDRIISRIFAEDSAKIPDEYTRILVFQSGFSKPNCRIVDR